MKSTVSIILVEPENVDNIGAVARTMKNMGLSDLRLVKPPRSWKRGGKKMAVNAYDLLQKATTYKNLKDAIADRHAAVALSRRHGSRRRDYLPFPKAIGLSRQKKKKIKVAYVFGKESKGLSNEDLAICDSMTTIPANPDYGSINLAQSVMVVAFSLFQPQNTAMEFATHDGEKMVKNMTSAPFSQVTKAEEKDVLARLKEAFKVLDYPKEGTDVLQRVIGTYSRLFSRATLLRSEANMFKGMARRILRLANKKRDKK